MFFVTHFGHRWSTQDAVLDLGTDCLGFGYGGTGKKSNSRQFDTYGEVCSSLLKQVLEKYN